MITTPVIQGDFIYGVCSYGQLRALELQTGRRLWESLQLTELARWAAAFLVKNADRFFVNNDQGDLIIARLTPRGYVELDRTRLIEPTSNSSWGPRPGQRRPGDRIVNWSHPAYANRHVFARNDREILCASLEGTPSGSAPTTGKLTAGLGKAEEVGQESIRAGDSGR